MGECSLALPSWNKDVIIVINNIIIIIIEYLGVIRVQALLVFAVYEEVDSFMFQTKNIQQVYIEHN